MLKRVGLHRIEARGRNGWFNGREAVIQALYGKVVADVRSSRPVYPGPVHLEMSPEDARAIGEALIAVADEVGGEK